MVAIRHSIGNHMISSAIWKKRENFLRRTKFKKLKGERNLTSL